MTSEFEACLTDLVVRYSNGHPVDFAAEAARLRKIAKSEVAPHIWKKAKEQPLRNCVLNLIHSSNVLVKIPVGFWPRRDSLSCGVTKIMKHYGLTARSCSAIETVVYDDVDDRERTMFEGAFDDLINPNTGQRWMRDFDLWVWTDTGPEFHSSKIPREQVVDADPVNATTTHRESFRQ